jgi:transcriptional regulator with XRE-family HTH domain
LFAEEPLRVERLKRFDRPMSQIFREWEKRLNPKNDEDLATMLGVTKMTIYRWRNDETKPDPTALARYEQWIDEYEKRFSHMVEQRLADRK